jgi:hypothetical protein
MQCGTVITNPADVVATPEGSFCRSCFGALKQQLEHALRNQGADINYPSAAVGGVLGGVVGALIWWGFTVVTNIAFGLVAVVIGFAVGKGVLRFSGGKRSRGLQALSVVISSVAFFYATYLVDRTFILKYYEQQGSTLDLPFFPDLTLLVEVVQAGFEFFDLIFLAIVVYQAWKIPAPVKLGLSGE